MATVESRRTRVSGSNGDHPAAGFPGFQFTDWLPAGRLHMTTQTAQAGLAGLDIMESWLAASRQMIDLWRTSIREQQDGMFAAWRQQIVNTLAHDLEEEASQGARRRSLAQTTVAKTGEAQDAATRH